MQNTSDRNQDRLPHKKSRQQRQLLTATTQIGQPMSDTQTTSRGADVQLSGVPQFTEAEEAWLAQVEAQHKVPLSAEQYDVVRSFVRSVDNSLRGAA